ncbi:PREDICTED: uncharacterized protein LOC104586750 [Nelumbo nucifera]|uniref:Uncharacterized protein LOC104586750 n=1 Tax=Nelumbo nucifera TaxID=4432 RepID=A0A1U7YQM4_NELNU|nr:PREDICTED: uncharacterized protein LOC104586750 [Nelumbo nucifera]
MGTSIENPNLSSLQITSMKLNEYNFREWSISARLFITGRGLLGYIDGKAKEPSEEDPEYKNWCQENAMVMLWLLSSMTPKIARTVQRFPTAAKIWEKISNTYGQRNNNMRLYRLHQDLAALRQGDMSVATYFATLEGLWEGLDYHQITVKLVEQGRIFKFLAGLDPIYEGIGSQILGRNELPDLQHVYYLIKNEEMRIKEMQMETPI